MLDLALGVRVLSDLTIQISLITTSYGQTGMRSGVSTNRKINGSSPVKNTPQTFVFPYLYVYEGNFGGIKIMRARLIYIGKIFPYVHALVLLFEYSIFRPLKITSEMNGIF